jgi:hypothetical protein
MERRRTYLWDLGLGSAVSVASQEAGRRMRSLMVALAGSSVAVD